MSPPFPDSGLRVSDNEREPVIDRLKDAYAEGRLEYDEFESRLQLTMLARTRSELESRESALSSARANKRDALGEVQATQQRLEGDIGNIEAQIQALNPHVRFVELDSHGVSTLRVTPDEVRMDWHYVADKRDPDSAVARAHSFRTRHDTARTERVVL